MSSAKSDYSPLGMISSAVHNADMQFDPIRSRQALEKFILTEGMVVSRWEIDSKIGGGTLRKFLAEETKSMNLKTYKALALSAGKKLGREVMVSELLGSSTERAYELPAKSDVRHLDPDVSLPQDSEMARDVPVFGTVSGSGGGLRMGDDQALDYVRRPPRFKDRRGKSKDIFAVLVEEVSMIPKYGPGDLLYIDPLRQPQIGDSVVVEIKEGATSEHRAILKILAARTASKITLEQYNPPRTFDVKLADIVHMFRVMTTNDLLGV